MKKKITVVLLTLLMGVFCAFGLASCGRQLNNHEHSYSTAWTYDETHHWHKATCEHTDEISGKAEHIFVNGICSNCGYQKRTAPHKHTFSSQWTKDEEYHWHKATCEHTTEVSGKAKHNFVDNICSDCGYEKVIPHEHTYSSAWTQDEEYHWHKATCEHTIEISGKEKHNFVDNVCLDCGYEKATQPHEHSYSTAWTKDEEYHWHEATCGHTTEVSGKAKHNFGAWQTVQDADCTTAGLKKRVCSDCAYEETEEIAALGHSTISHSAQAATCTENGWNAYETCSHCDYTTYHETAALGHKYATEFTIDKQATCTENGSKSRHCSRCDSKTETEEITALGHSAVSHSAQAATCTEKGWNAYETCSRCDYTTYHEIAALGHDTISHSAQAATCTENGWDIYNTCSRCDYTTYHEIAALGHDMISHSAQAATCTENGWDAYETCSRCDYATYHEIVALGHDTVSHSAQAATCTEKGWNAYETCSRCDYTTYHEITALGHNYTTEFTVDKQVTCTENGSKSKHCSRCDSKTETEEIIALGHDTVSHSAQAATCNEKGWSAYETCSRCDYTTYSEISALGHEFINYVSNSEATCILNATEIGYCSRCSATSIREIENTALGHVKGEIQSIVEPSCLNQGYTTYICDVCGEEFNADYQDALGHNYNSEWICIRCNHEYETDGLIYRLSSDETYYSVIGYSGDSSRVIIPKHYNNLPVTKIETEAFKDNTNINYVFLSILMQSIGESAFNGCTALSSINLRANLLFIGFAALQNTGFTSLSVPFIGDGNGHTNFGYIFGASSYSSNGSYVPASLKAVKITGGSNIASSAFSNCSKLTSVTVGSGVTSIGSSAFFNCSGLTSVTISDSVKSIGSSAFSGCSSLERIMLPFVGGSKKTASDTYQYPFGYIFGTSSYAGGVATTQYYYGSSTSRTTSTTYYIPSPLKSVTITGGNILYGAFYNCSKLTNVAIPDSVTSIGDSSFRYCSGLTSATIPNSVMSIGNYAFYGCSGLTSITLPFVGKALNGTEDTHFGYIFGAVSYQYNSDYVPTSLKTVVITGGESIGGWAFSNCSGLMSVTIPDSVTSIGSWAFSDCNSLIYNIYNNAKYLGNKNNPYVALIEANDMSLTSCTIQENTKVIYSGAFSDCSGLTSVTIPNSVTSIGESAFNGCSGLTGELKIPDSMTSIGDSAFKNCSGLTSVTIPNGVTSIGSDAFSGCSGLENITVNDDNTVYASRDGILYNKAKTEFVHIPQAIKGNITIPNGVTSIGSSAFSGCSGLTSITIPDSVTSIGSSAFYNCSGLTSITLPFVGASKSGGSYTIFGYIFGASSGSLNSYYMPSSLKTVIITGGEIIGYEAFRGCGRLTSITIPNGVTSISSYAFYNCSGLTSIIIPNGVTSIGDYAFNGCSGLTSELKIPNGVTSIGTCAFNGCSGLTGELKIPNGVTSIGSYAFDNCSGLTSLEIPKSVTSIGALAYNKSSRLTSIKFEDIASYCRIGMPGNLGGVSKVYIDNQKLIEMTKIVIPNGVTSIGNYAFSGCHGLTSVTIPNSVTSIGDSAFKNCSGLTSVTIPNSVTSIWAMAFSDCSGLTSVTIPNSVTIIASYAFYNCSRLTSVTIGNGVKEIVAHTFEGCSGLTGELKIPDSVTSIGTCAFSGCGGLTSITIPNSVTSIEWGAFEDCSGLTSIVFKNTRGWQVSESFDMSSATSLSSSNLSNSATAAAYLKSTYCSYYWKRS